MDRNLNYAQGTVNGSATTPASEGDAMARSPYFSMARIRPQRLSIQLLLLFTLLLGGSMVTFILRGVIEQSDHHAEAMKMQARVLARNLAATAADKLLTRDYTSIELSLIRSARFPGILNIQVTDAQGNLLGDVVGNPTGDPVPRYGGTAVTPPADARETIILRDQNMTVWEPVFLGDLLGWVKVTYSLQVIEEELAEIWGNNAIAGFAIILVTGLLLAFLLRRPVATIRGYTEFADRLDACDGEQVAVETCTLELGTLGLALNKASTRLKEQSLAIKTAMADLERIAAFPKHAPYFVMSLNNDVQVQYVNPYGRRMLAQLEIDEQDIMVLLPGEIRELVHTVIQRRKTFSRIEVLCQGRTLSWTFAPVSGRNIVHSYGIDITEMKKAEKQAHAALVEKLSAIEASKAKSQFLANMSHELRTPLNAIIGYSELLEEEAVDGGYSDVVPDLKKIQSAGRHLLSLINGILDLSKIEANRMELYLEQLSVSSLLHDVITTTQPLIEKNNNRFDVHCDQDLGSMRTDAVKLRQILINLLSNASKFTENGSIELSVNQERIDADDWITFEVKDTGIGMTPEQLDRVFKAFTQADGSTTRKYGGTGLGLAITKSFCEMLGGEVSVTSEKDAGTRFRVRVPAALADDVSQTQRQGENPEHGPSVGELPETA